MNRTLEEWRTYIGDDATAACLFVLQDVVYDTAWPNEFVEYLYRYLREQAPDATLEKVIQTLEKMQDTLKTMLEAISRDHV